LEVDLTDLTRKKLSLFILLIFMMLACSHNSGEDSSLADYPFSSEGRVHPQVLEHLRSEWIPSAYFDRGMHYEGSQFRTVRLTELIQRFHPEDKWSAVLLDCHDDYQGIISMDDILEYELRLALEMKLAPNIKRPNWLNPMVVIVPDLKEAPRQERFMTANIRELRFVRLLDYYAPLDLAFKSMHAHRGGQAFKDNCLFCHSLKGVGGNKGVNLLKTYNFAKGAGGGPQFKKDFVAFHNKDNADKQDMEQFVDSDTLRRIVVFLREIQKDR
jgi:hypothetical protein